MSSSAASANPILRATLGWSAAIAAALAVLGAVLGFAVAGAPGLFSALAGVVIAAVFLGITAASVLIANRWFGDPRQLPMFFGIVLGGWVLKLVVFIVLLILMRSQEWIEPYVFFFAILASVIASLVVDIVVLARSRVPYVGEVALPTSSDEPSGGTPNA